MWHQNHSGQNDCGTRVALARMIVVPEWLRGSI
nr:MAG TPA: hypothetical protein [Caudoviricetes sp.]